MPEWVVGVGQGILIVADQRKNLILFAGTINNQAQLTLKTIVKSVCPMDTRVVGSRTSRAITS
jgi:hypothetical protein